MDAAKLLPQPGEPADAAIIERTLLVSVSPKDDETGIAARQGLVGDRTLTSLREVKESFHLRPIRGVPCWLAPTNPFLTAKQKERLDKRGIIRRGTVLQSDDILVSALQKVLPT